MTSFLILSDIHACDEDPSSRNAPSYVSSFNAAASARHDPLTDLKRALEDAQISPDYLLCAGDITNRSNPSAFSYAWRRLNELSAELGARFVATVGNHDLDSRFQANKYDPRGYAMSLAPTLPVSERSAYLEFWAENFTLLQFDDCNIAVLNTAAYHGTGKDAEREIEHGRISDVTLERLKSALAAAPERSTNILLCHHHPIRSEPGDPELVGLTRGGPELIVLLGHLTAHWIIVHGHKHVPDLFYGDGGANAPVVLGSASFSAQVNQDAQNKNPNQVHLLVTDPEGAEADGLTCAGAVHSWTWQAGVGWSKAQGMQGLPHITGFGYRSSLRALAQKVKAHLNNAGVTYMAWSRMVTLEPSIMRLIPVDFSQFREKLHAETLTILGDEYGDYAQIGHSK